MSIYITGKSESWHKECSNLMIITHKRLRDLRTLYIMCHF